MTATPDQASPTPTGESVFDWIDARAQARAEAGLTRRLRPRPAAATTLDLASTDYLGLARDKRVVGAAAAAALRWGAGATGSRLASGSTELHTELEYELAAFCGAPAALVFSSGYLANLAALTALSGQGTAIVADQHIHASLIDGCRLAKADVAVAGHREPARVAHALGTRGDRRALVVTDSVFTADGDLAPLPELAEVCRTHNAGLVVADVHGFGVLGPGGRGAVAEAGLIGAPDVVTTLSLAAALGGQGGAVLGSRRVIRHLVDSARGLLFDTGLAPASAAAALAALQVLREEPERAERARSHALELANRLRAAGLPVSEPAAALVSVRAPSAEAAVAWAEACRAAGVVVGCCLPPAVPDQVCRLRLTVRAELTETDLDRAADALVSTAPAPVGSTRR